jgi:hypothetical protein
MNLEEFFRTVSPLDESQLRKALWNLYWRGTANVRERIERELAGEGSGRPVRPARPAVDAELLRAEVDQFVSLARAGAYLAGDRRVSPRERTRWRFTFKRLTTEAQQALSAEDHAPASAALEQLIDLACETHDYDYFRSEDPMEAAGFVVSDAAAMLWATMWERHGFQAFTEAAAPQLIRWESPFGWTRQGDGPVAAKETSLAAVIARMLRVADRWERFAEQYLRALDEVSTSKKIRFGHGKERRADALAQWHGLLLENLEDTPGGVLDRIAAHHLGRSRATVSRCPAGAPPR